jgi:hypothetical protein
VLKVFMASAGQRNHQEILSELKRLGMARGLDETSKIKVLFEAVVDTSKGKLIGEEFAKNAVLIKLMIRPPMVTQTTLLACVEEMVGVSQPHLLNYTPLIIQSLYESDVLEEEAILAWHESPPEASYMVNKDVAVNVRAKATPFITW